MPTQSNEFNTEYDAPVPIGGWGLGVPDFGSAHSRNVLLGSPELPPLSQNWLRVPFNCLNACLKEQERKRDVDFARLTTFVERIERRVLASHPNAASARRGRRSRFASDASVHLSNQGRRGGTFSHDYTSATASHDIIGADDTEYGAQNDVHILKTTPTINNLPSSTECQDSMSHGPQEKAHDGDSLTNGMGGEDTAVLLQEFMKNIDRALQFLQKITRKLQLAEEESKRYIKKLYVRLRVLEKETDVKLCHENINFNFDYYTRTIDCILHEFLGRRGMLRTAAKLSEDYNLDDLVDSEVYAEAGEIVNSLRKHDTRGALEFCAAHRERLQATKSPLEAQLHLQHLITLLADMRHQEALQYVQTSLHPELFDLCAELRQAVTLIAFCHNPPDAYKHLLSKERWVGLENNFRETFAAVFGFAQLPVIEMLLQAGLCALKSKGCEDNLSASCPTCQPQWQNYVKTLPTVNRLHTHLICPISGETMNDANPPMVSPEGNIYSTKGLLSSASPDGLVVSPRSSKRYPIDRFQRLYIS